MSKICFGEGDPLYERYHDEEWGRPVRDERGLYEKLCLEAFQSGLAWITILRKRDAFRAAFADFDPERWRASASATSTGCSNDAGIVRNRLKIEAAIANAKATVALRDGRGPLPELIWAHAPARRPRRRGRGPTSQALTPESTALAKELKRNGFRFVGPTTAYALMQACGLVNDHLAGCRVRADVEREPEGHEDDRASAPCVRRPAARGRAGEDAPRGRAPAARDPDAGPAARGCLPCARGWRGSTIPRTSTAIERPAVRRDVGQPRHDPHRCGPRTSHVAAVALTAPTQRPGSPGGSTGRLRQRHRAQAIKAIGRALADDGPLTRESSSSAPACRGPAVRPPRVRRLLRGRRSSAARSSAASTRTSAPRTGSARRRSASTATRRSPSSRAATWPLRPGDRGRPRLLERAAQARRARRPGLDRPRADPARRRARGPEEAPRRTGARAGEAPAALGQLPPRLEGPRLPDRPAAHAQHLRQRDDRAGRVARRDARRALDRAERPRADRAVRRPGDRLRHGGEIRGAVHRTPVESRHAGHRRCGRSHHRASWARPRWPSRTWSSTSRWPGVQDQRPAHGRPGRQHLGGARQTPSAG